MHIHHIEPSSRMTFDLWSHMYDWSACFCEVIGFDSGSEFSKSDNDDVVGVVGNGLSRLESYVKGCKRLARMLLTFFFGGSIVYVWRNGELGVYMSLYST